MDPKEFVILEADINFQLQPVWEMLKHYKGKRRPSDWASLVERTRKSVLKYPHEYIEMDSKSKELIRKAINIVFEEYVRSGYY